MVLTVRFYTKKYDFFIKKQKTEVCPCFSKTGTDLGFVIFLNQKQAKTGTDLTLPKTTFL